jgi:hypothetical protein
VEPLPKGLVGGARQNVLRGLLARKLIEEQTASPCDPVWRTTRENVDLTLVLSEAGAAAIGRPRPNETQVLEEPGSKESTTDAPPLLETVPAKTPRPGSKLALLVDALRRPEGATTNDLMRATGWQPHSIRGVLSGQIKKNLGYAVVAERGASGETVYRIT